MPNRPVEPSQTDRPDTSAYTLDELTSATGVTVRTVRYYISEGLLPPPRGAGPGTRYTSEHLDRLILIGALKDAYLPLKEIRRRIAGMTDAEIHEAVERMHVRSEGPADEYANEHQDVDAVSPTYLMASPPDDDRPNQSSAASSAAAGAAAGAAAYIEAVLRGEMPGGSAPRAEVRLPPGSMRFPGANEPGPQPDAESAPATWRRIAISPEAELLIEESTYRRRSEQIEALVAWAQRILTS